MAGMFHTSNGRVGKRAWSLARRKAEGARNLNQFAELLCGGDDEANAMTISEAAAAMGISQQRGSQLFKKIRDGLGEQAR